MNKELNNFLDEVCERIKYKKIHSEIRTELSEHILSLSEEYKKGGLTEDEAVRKAVLQMGNSEEIGDRLNKQHKPETEWSLLFLVSIIVSIGGMIMFECSKYQSMNSVYFERYLFIALLSIAVMLGVYFYDYTRLRNRSFSLYTGLFILFLIIKLFGITVAGRPIIKVGSFSVLPEFLSPFFLIAFAGILDGYKGGGTFSLVKLIILAFLSVALMFLFPAKGMAVLLFSGFFVILMTGILRGNFGGKVRNQMLLLFCIFSMIIFLVLLSLQPYQLERIKVFLDKDRDIMGSGYQQYIARKWISMSKWFGKTGLTFNGSPLESILPGANTDFVFVNIVATFGKALGLGLIIAVAAFIIRMFAVTRKIKNDYGFYLSLSSCVILSLQFILSILVNLNMFPLASVSMPFISYGGTNYIVDMILLGIILSVWRRNNIVKRTGIGSKSLPYRKFISYEDGRIIINLK